MTAKELAEEAIEIIGSCVRLGTKYHFTESEFEDFCAQLCKEQRKIIANNLIGIAVTHPWFPLDDCVINALTGGNVSRYTEVRENTRGVAIALKSRQDCFLFKFWQ